jgi:hypothetical protein
MNRVLALTISATAFSLLGCAGQIRVFDDRGTETPGIPIRTTETYVKQGAYTKHSKGGECAATPFVETVSIATGALYFVSAKSALFAKTAFHVKFAENGSASSIGLDSEPSGAELLKAGSELIKLALPPLGLAAAGLPARATAGQAPACDVGEANVTYTPLSGYLRKQAK